MERANEKIYYNNYPIVFIHGMTGWGEDDKLDEHLLPYWGRGNKNLLAHLQRHGYECYHPTQGPWNSAWDRACELWAYLFGGTVDYGKVHSERAGHARFGRTYEFGVLEDLGMTNAHKKFNIIGHSFGGPVVKEVCNLLLQGSEAERTGTHPDDLSPLFLGGHGDLIHCAATLSGVNNGTTLASSQKRLIKPVMGGLMMLNVALRDTPIMKYYNFHTQQWGLMEWPDQNDTWKFHSPFSRMAGVRAFVNDKDNDAWECTIEVVQEEVNPNQVISPNIYYFANRAANSHANPTGFHFPNMPMALFCFCPGLLMGLPTNKALNEQYGITRGSNWMPHDGFVNVIGQSGPLNAPNTLGEWGVGQVFRPGVWYNMPVINGDHVWWNGISAKKAEYFRYYDIMLDKWRRLPDGETVESYKLQDDR